MKKQQSPENIKSFKRVEFSNRYLTIFALVFGVIGAFFLIKTLAAPSLVLSVEAENMAKPTSARVIADSAASLGQAVQLNNDSSIDSNFSLASSSNQINLRLKASYCDKNWPKVRVSVDGVIVSKTSIVSSKEWKTVQNTVQLSKGGHRLKIDGINLGSNRGCTKSLSVDNVLFYGENAVPPPPPLPAVTISANPSTVNSGTASTLTWTTTNATSCAASGSWSGAQPTTGTTSTGALNKNSTYTLSCTGTGGSTNASTTVIVIPVATPPAPPPTPTPTPPPPTPTPTPPPSSGGTCTTASTTGCVAGTTITQTNSQWTCNKALSSYGKLPIKVIVNATGPYGGNGGVDLTTGCAGDGDSGTIDLIVDVKGDGRTYGPGADAVKVRLEAGYNASIQLTGSANCGPRTDSAVHQDGIQAQGGRNVTFVDFNIGNYDNGTSTCQGAGGAFFYSSAGGYSANNIQLIRGKYIACNHGLLANQGSGSVTGSFFRAGRTDGTDPVCVGYSAAGACTGTNATRTNVTCQNWSSGTKTWQ